MLLAEPFADKAMIPDRWYCRSPARWRGNFLIPGNTNVKRVEITECGYEDFDEVVIKTSEEIPVLVDFWADWCAPCHAIAPQLERVVSDLEGGIRLVKVEVDAGENMKLAGHYRLRGFPTVMLFNRGKERGRFSGARHAPWIEHWIDQHL